MKLIYHIAALYNSGGMERVLSFKANWFASRGHEVVIITTDQMGRAPFFPLDERIRCVDLEINYEENNGKSFLNKLLHFPAKQWDHKRKLTALLNEEKADIVVSMFCNDASFLSSIKDGSRKVLEIHFSRFKLLQYGRKGLFRLADIYRSNRYTKIAKLFDRFVVLTEEDKGYWGDLPNIEVIPNARPFVTSDPAVLTNKKVIAVGRYSHQKGFERLIAAWNIICREVDGWTLHIVGDGELRPILQAQIERLGLSGSIKLGKAEKDMPSVYKEASILALSSRYEGLPMVLLEAQAAGLPIVAFSCKCGPKDVIKEGLDGLLVEEGDVAMLAEKLLILMKNDTLRQQMGKAAFARSERYSEELVMKQWGDLFDGLLQ